MRAHAPPQLGRLDDPLGPRQQVDEVGVGRPVTERLRHPAAGEGAGEDLAAHRVQAGVLAVEKRRVRRERQQRRQQAAQVVAHRDRPVRAADPHVHVQAPCVVALRDPAQLLAQAVVVLGVDDLLVEVVGPRVGAGRRQRDAEALGRGEQPPASIALQLDRLGEVFGAPGADLDLRVDQLPGDRVGQDLVGHARVAQLAEAVHQLEAVGVHQRELLLEADREVL